MQNLSTQGRLRMQLVVLVLLDAFCRRMLHMLRLKEAAAVFVATGTKMLLCKRPQFEGIALQRSRENGTGGL